MGADFWEKVDFIVRDKKINITADQQKALKYAMRIPVQFPSAYQSLQLISLLEEAKANGLKV